MYVNFIDFNLNVFYNLANSERIYKTACGLDRWSDLTTLYIFHIYLAN